MGGGPKLRIEKLSAHHDLPAFDCGTQALNAFLQRRALASQKSGSAQTYLAMAGEAVAGFYSLTFGQIEYAGAPDRLRKGLPRHPVPVMLLARLAVDRGWQGQRLGSGLLKDAILRTLQAADIAGLRVLAVHAKDGEARAFYETFGFIPFEDQPLVLYRLIKDIRQMLEG
ncbi:GNAT family N-acetyltransferase [Pannonibacter indicus]|jgi:GNAT superfamily N-acetyltransferase|uniref:Acetyltransferase (GNAT) family n=1 Tax=Pannonibacter indicus TaxID=466044 RepID=A0A0K6I7T6_9HYPH|nr:GNAT family N-acetyltransferase [Pannonibacter indicus]CUA99190.1 Acetyltransferase (GNAT) family [Pannonibacter indicus]